MNNDYTNVLFSLYMNGGDGTLSWLMEYLHDNNVSESESAHNIQNSISKLVSAKLLDIYITKGDVIVALTDKGTQVALAAAEIISDRMVNEWQKEHGVIKNA